MWLKCLSLLFSNITLMIVLFDLQQYNSCVEATSKHVRPLSSWFSSLEQIDLQDNRGVLSTTTEQIDTTTQYKKKHRKRRLKKKDKGRLTSEEIKPKKKRKKKEERKFVKTVVRERDGEYNASSSIENEDRRKPVDIIVHIKMHD